VRGTPSEGAAPSFRQAFIHSAARPPASGVRSGACRHHTLSCCCSGTFSQFRMPLSFHLIWRRRDLRSYGYLLCCNESVPWRCRLRWCGSRPLGSGRVRGPARSHRWRWTGQNLYSIASKRRWGHYKLRWLLERLPYLCIERWLLSKWLRPPQSYQFLSYLVLDRFLSSESCHLFSRFYGVW